MPFNLVDHVEESGFVVLRLCHELQETVELQGAAFGRDLVDQRGELFGGAVFFGGFLLRFLLAWVGFLLFGVEVGVRVEVVLLDDAFDQMRIDIHLEHLVHRFLLRHPLQQQHNLSLDVGHHRVDVLVGCTPEGEPFDHIHYLLSPCFLVCDQDLNKVVEV